MSIVATLMAFQMLLLLALLSSRDSPQKRMRSSSCVYFDFMLTLIFFSALCLIPRWARWSIPEYNAT